MKHRKPKFGIGRRLWFIPEDPNVEEFCAGIFIFLCMCLVIYLIVEGVPV